MCLSKTQGETLPGRETSLGDQRPIGSMYQSSLRLGRAVGSNPVAMAAFGVAGVVTSPMGSIDASLRSHGGTMPGLLPDGCRGFWGKSMGAIIFVFVPSVPGLFRGVARCTFNQQAEYLQKNEADARRYPEMAYG